MHDIIMVIFAYIDPDQRFTQLAKLHAPVTLDCVVIYSVYLFSVTVLKSVGA